jgi:predicted  nucleic acid-binding Zn-ribbon protein
MSELTDLLGLQDLDTAADQLTHRRQHLPERSELAALEAQMAALGEELAGVEAGLADITARQTRAEAELSATEERSAAVNRRLYGGAVSASRELQAMAAELEQLKHRASDLEDVVLGLLEEREPLEARAAELARRLDELAGQRSEVAARLAGAEAVVDAELSELADRRRQAAGAVSETLMATYDRLRRRLGGVAVARLAGNRCDGCHLTLSAVELERVRHLAEGEVYTCEQCSRIIVP